MRGTVVLFDIDGTLLRADGAGRRCFTSAFEAVFGVSEAFAGVPFSGRTDLDLLLCACHAHLGRDPATHEAEAFFDGYHLALDADLADGAGCEVLPGVAAMLAWLARLPDVAVGLATGNAEAGAWIKLRHGGLDRWFAFGGFGSDHRDRQILTRLGAERGAARLGATLDDVRVIVVGDSEHDVRCAHGIQALAVAVETGWTPRERLLAEHPEVLLPDLTSFGAWMEEVGIGR